MFKFSKKLRKTRTAPQGIKKDGPQIVNVSSFPITFASTEGSTFVVPPSGKIILGRAAQVDIPVPPGAPRRIQSGYVPMEMGLADLKRLEDENPGAVIVGSLKAAEAYTGRVLYPVPVDGYEDMPPGHRVMRSDVFVQRVPQVPADADLTIGGETR